LGPYLSIYLLLVHHWDQASIGFVMAAGGIGAIVAQAPAGALVDRTTAKRALIVGGALPLHAVRQLVLAGRRAVAGRRRRGGVRCAVSARRPGRHARDGPVQHEPGCGDGRYGHRRVGVESVAGWVVVAAGYDAAFASLGAIAGAGFVLYLFAVPETATAAWDTRT
jgi:hypothetical protein